MPISKATITLLATGVPGLDEVLGGGLPEFSFNLIAGSPGCAGTRDQGGADRFHCAGDWGDGHGEGVDCSRDP